MKTKEIILNIARVIVFVLLVVSCVLLIRNYGPHALLIHFLDGLYFIAFGVGFIIYLVLDYIKKKDEQKAKARLVAYIIAFVMLSAFIVYGGVLCGQSVADMNHEPETIMLWNCSARTYTSGGRYRVTRKKIQGTNGTTTYSFDVTGMNKTEWKQLENRRTQLAIYYYPTSKVVYKVEEIGLVEYLQSQ